MHRIFPGRDDNCAPGMPADVDSAMVVDVESMQTSTKSHTFTTAIHVKDISQKFCPFGVYDEKITE
jgi:hypothetical protein